MDQYAPVNIAWHTEGTWKTNSIVGKISIDYFILYTSISENTFDYQPFFLSLAPLIPFTSTNFLLQHPFTDSIGVR